MVHSGRAALKAQILVPLSQCKAGGAEGGPGDADLLQGGAEDDCVRVSEPPLVSDQL